MRRQLDGTEHDHVVIDAMIRYFHCNYLTREMRAGLERCEQFNRSSDKTPCKVTHNTASNKYCGCYRVRVFCVRRGEHVMTLLTIISLFHESHSFCRLSRSFPIVGVKISSILVGTETTSDHQYFLSSLQQFTNLVCKAQGLPFYQCRGIDMD